MQPKTPPRRLIDDDFFARWGNKVFDESEILWEGSPKAGFSVALLEKGTYHDVMTGPSGCVFLGISFYLWVLFN